MMKRILILTAVLAAAVAAFGQYKIYPVPQKQTAQAGTARLTAAVTVVSDEAIDAATKARALDVLAGHGLTGQVAAAPVAGQSTLYLRVDPSVAVANKFDAHRVVLAATPDGLAELTVTGQHTDAAFYGLASVEQMLEQAPADELPQVVIDDYADQRQRGIVEGYYGYPYSVAVKKDLMRYMMRLKMNTYLYGAKSDPYHSSNWKEAYPASITEEQERGGWLSQDMVRELAEESQQTKVNFIWAIHPGNNFVGSGTVVSDIMGKFKLMHKLGVRQFGVFVDDVSIPSTEADMKTNADRLTQLQQSIEKTFNAPGTAPADTVRPLHFVPQIYCRSFAGSQEQFENFFKALSATPDYITVYTTGWGVWSVPNVSDFNNTAQYLGREVAWWWNYPCNDNADSQIYPMDMYQNFADMPAVGSSSTLPASMQNRGCGIVSNPMQQGEVAKIPLFSVADYAWHCAGFKNKDSWAASFPFVMSNATYAEALKTLAPYLTLNDPSGAFTATLTLSSAQKKAEPLLAACQTLETLAESPVESDRLFYNDVRPWLMKFHRTLQAYLDLLQTKQMANTDGEGRLNEEKWLDYVEQMDVLDDMAQSPDYEVTTLEGMDYRNVGHHRAKPAEKYLGAAIATLKTSAIKGFVPAKATKPTFLTNTDYSGTATVSANTYAAAVSVHAYEPGQYAGLSLPEARLCTVSVQDTLLQGRELWCSADGKDWQTLAIGEQPTQPVRHFIVVNSSSAKSYFKLAKSVFTVTATPDPTIAGVKVPEGDDYGGHEVKYLTDGDYTTWFTKNQNQKTGDAFMLTLSAEVPLSRVRVAIGTTNGDYMNTGRIEISTDQKTWTRLSPVGKTKTSFTLSDMQPLSDESKVLDFDAKGQAARYIRLYNQSANTGKWLRLYEIEPFYAVTLPEAQTDKGEALPQATDGQADTYADIAAPAALIYRFQQAGEAESLTLLTQHGVQVITAGEGTFLPLAKDFTLAASDGTLRLYEAFTTLTPKTIDVVGITPAALLPSAPAAVAPACDLQGRTVAPGKAALPAGLYIQGGRKVLRR